MMSMPSVGKAGGNAANQSTNALLGGSAVALSCGAAWLLLRRKPRGRTSGPANAQQGHSGKGFAGSGPSDEQKMVLVVRKDLGMKQGKIAAQCAHASIGVYSSESRRGSKRLRAWELQGQPKVCVKADSLREIEELEQAARKLNLPTFTVQDAGRTQIDAGSVTVLAVGPGTKSKVDKVTGSQKLL
jgi:peptidyl-tRNA hydrolase